MSRKKRGFTTMEDDYIRRSYGNKSVREMASEMGRSRSGVQMRISALGLNKQPPADVSKTLRSVHDERKQLSNRDSDTLSRLIELRDILYCALGDAGANSKPRVAAEYRAVLKDIQEMKKHEESGRESGFDALFAELSGKSDP